MTDWATVPPPADPWANVPPPEPTGQGDGGVNGGDSQVLPPPDALIPPLEAEMPEMAQASGDDTPSFLAWKANTPGVDPKRAGLAWAHARARGLDPTWTAEHLDAIQADDERRTLADTLAAHPGLAKQFESPVKGAMLKDEMANAAVWERLVTGRFSVGYGGRVRWTAPGVLRSVAHEVQAFDTARLGLKQALGAADDEDLATLEQRQAEGETDFGAANEVERSLYKAAGFVPYVLGQTLARAGAGLAGAAVGTAVAGPAGGLAGGFAGAFGAGSTIDFLNNVGPLYRQILASGRETMPETSPGAGDSIDIQHIDEADAFELAVGASFATSLVSGGLFPAAFGNLPFVRKALERYTAQSVAKVVADRTLGQALAAGGKSWGKSWLAGVGLMAGQAAANQAAVEAGKGGAGLEVDPMAPVSAGWEAAKDVALAMVIVGAHHPIREFHRDLGRMAVAREDQARFEQLAASVEASKLPSAEIERVLAELHQEGRDDDKGDVSTVYVDRVAFDRVAEAEGVRPADLAAEVLGDGGKAYAEGAASGDAVAVPVAKYAARMVKSGLHEKLKDDVRFSAEGLTPREAKAHAKVADEVAKMADGPGQAELLAVRDRWVGMATAAGQKKGVVEATADLVTHAVATHAAREKLTPAEAAKAMRLDTLRITKDGGLVEGVALGPGRVTSLAQPSFAPLSDATLPAAGAEVDGLAVRGTVPSTGAIAASYAPGEFRVLPGIRELSMDGWVQDPERAHYDANDQRRAKDLAREIDANKEIAPLIVTLDAHGEPYILEGQHRLTALALLGKKSFPALVVQEVARRQPAIDLGDGAKATVLEQPAFHGTPHVVEGGFKLNKIGTGEGAQVYGHGLYFAESKGVAKQYQRQLGDTEVRFRGALVDKPTVDQVLSRDGTEAEAQRTVFARIRGLGKALADLGTPETDPKKLIATVTSDIWKGIHANTEAAESGPEAHRESSRRVVRSLENQLRAIQDMDPADVGVRNTGHLYQAEVPEKSALLDYDKPLAGQPPAILDKMAEAGIIPPDAVEHIKAYDALSERMVALGDVPFEQRGTPESAAEHQRLLEERQAHLELGGFRGGLPIAGGQRVSPFTSGGGREVYEALSRRAEAEHRSMGASLSREAARKAASETLRAAGIPGLMYLDQGSRSDGKGTHNFVIWDEGAITKVTQLEQDARGKLLILEGPAGKRYEIHLGKEANASTLAHETAHWLADTLQDAALREGASEGLRADMDALAKASGYASAEERAKGLVEANEEFIARAFEQYLADGRAPTEALGRVFSRFARWLAKVYVASGLFQPGRTKIGDLYEQQFEGRPLDVTPEVRGIFDRILATADEMESAPAELRDSIIAGAPEEQRAALKNRARAQQVRASSVRQILEAKPLSSITPGQYLAAERKAGREALRLATAGKHAEALDADAQRAWAKEMHTQAKKLQREGEVARKYLDRQASEKNRAALGKLTREVLDPATGEPTGELSQPYLEQQDRLLAGLDTSANTSAPEVNRRAATEKWMAEEIAEGRDPVLPPSVLAHMDKQTRVRDLTIGELRDLMRAVKNNAALGNLKATILENGKRVDFERGKLELVKRAAAVNKARPQEAIDTKPLVDHLVAGATSPLVLMRQLDGGDINGPWHRYVYNVISDARTKFHALARELAQPVTEALQKLGADDLARWKGTHTITGFPGPVPHEACVAVALNVGNASNASKLLRGWMKSQSAQKDGFRWSERTVQEMLGKLTASDWDFVQLVWDRMESQWPEMVNLEKRLTGLAPDKVEVRPFTIATLDGVQKTLRGGYYPMMYDSRYAKERLGGDDLFSGDYVRAATPQGQLESRVENFARPVRLSVLDAPRGLSNVAKDLGMREAVLSVDKILSSSAVHDAIRSAAGERAYELTRDWLRDLVNDQAVGRSGIERVMLAARGRVSAGIFAYNVGQTLQNLGVLPLMLGTIGPKWVLPAFGRVVSGYSDVTRVQRAESGEMAHRASEGNALQADLEQAFRASSFAMKEHQFVRFGLEVWKSTDRLTSAIAYEAAHTKALASTKDGGLALSPDLAVRYAEEQVNLRVMAADAKDLPAQLRGKLGKVMLPLAGYSYNRINQLLDARTDIAASRRDGVRNAALKTVAALVGGLVAEGIMSDLVMGRGPRDDDKDGSVDGMDWAQWLASSAFWAIPKIVPVLGSAIKASEYKRDVGGPPETQMWSYAAKVLTDIQTLNKQRADGGGLSAVEDKAVEALVLDVLTGIGAARGLPVSQVRATGGYLNAIRKGEEVPQGPGDVALGLAYGKRSTLKKAIYPNASQK